MCNVNVIILFSIISSCYHERERCTLMKTHRYDSQLQNYYTLFHRLIFDIHTVGRSICSHRTKVRNNNVEQ